MVDRVSDRISDWLPEDLTSPAEINRAIADSGWSDEWGEGTTKAVSDFIAEDRTIDFQEIQREGRKATTVLGPQDSRQAAIRAADGTNIGKPDNVEFFKRGGEVYAYNTDRDEPPYGAAAAKKVHKGDR